MILLSKLYYEGKKEWTVPQNFADRITNGQDFLEYLPDFKYYLVPLNNYSNKELMAKKDEISLVLMINKMQTKEDIEAFRMLPAKDIEAIVKDSPEHLVAIIADILLAFLLKINVPVSEAEQLTDKVREKKMAELFENMEKLDIQAERRNTEAQRQRAENAEQKARTAEQKAEATISLLIESYQAIGMSRNLAAKKLTQKLGLDENDAKAKIDHYWDIPQDKL